MVALQVQVTGKNESEVTGRVCIVRVLCPVVFNGQASFTLRYQDWHDPIGSTSICRLPP